MTYPESVDWLFQQFPAWQVQGALAYKPGLENVVALSGIFGNPHRDLKFVHVAGTNGKGSVSNYLASICSEDGKRTGLFTSPHLFDFRERIRVNGSMIPQEYVVDFCEKIQSATLVVKPSFFEITWIMALCYFRDQNCDIVIAETGLGGRLDATNIITPLLSVITTIGLDHTAILGNTRSEIALEKAGIIKSSVPVIIGQSDEEVLPVFQAKAREMNSELICVKQNQQADFTERNLKTSEAAAAQLVKVGFLHSETSIGKGVRNVNRNTGFVGRMQQVASSPAIFVDAAHNPDGIRALLNAVSERDYEKLHIVYGTSSDKDLGGMVDLFPPEATLYLTTFSNPRSASQQQLREAFGESATVYDDAHEAFETALHAASVNDLILITGSFFLLQEFENLLQG